MQARNATPKTTAAARAGLALLCVQLAACGVEIGNPKKPKDAPQTTSAVYLIDDQSVAGGVISAQVDQVVSAAAEEAALNPFGLGSLTGVLTHIGPPPGPPPAGGANPPPPLSPQVDATTGAVSTCTQTSADAAVVVIKASGDLSRTFGAPDHPVSIAGSRDGTISSTWTSPSTPIPCTTDKSNVTIDWTGADGMTLATTVSDTRSMTTTRSGPKGSFSRDLQEQLTGTRNASWSIDKSGTTATALTLTKTVTGTLTDSITTQRHNGDTVTLVSAINVSAATPVVISILRDKTTDTWQSKTVLSGTVLSTQGADSRLEAVYANLKFVNGSGCTPTSGSVSGSIYHGTDASPARRFTISFADGVGTITYDDATTDTYVPQYCDLDDSGNATASGTDTGTGTNTGTSTAH